MSRKPTTRVLPCGPKGRMCVDVRARVLFFLSERIIIIIIVRIRYTVVVGCVCVCALERKREWGKTERKTSRFDTLAYVIVRDCGARGGQALKTKKI